MKKFNFNHSKQLSELIFIDGISRSGKSVLSGIIPCFYKVEQIRFFTLLENINIALRFKKIDSSFAKSQIVTFLNETIYDGYLGRNINFRKKDQSSVYEYCNPSIYKKRLLSSEGGVTIKKILKEKPSLLFQTHDVLANFQYFKKLKLKCKLLEIFRNPFDTVYSWHRKGWGHRFVGDPQCFTIFIKHQDKNVPWYSYKNPKKWHNFNNIERCSQNIIDLTNDSILSLKKERGFKENIYPFKFEDFVTSPENIINEISIFLKKKHIKNMTKKIKDANCPRIINEEDQIRKKFFIKENVNKKIFSSLLNLEKNYKKNFYSF